MARERIKKQIPWMSLTDEDFEKEEDLQVCRLIVLRIVRFMKDNNLTQKDLAEKLNVTPQYINKFLHGHDLDLKISTVVRYQRLLGIKLLEIPSESAKNANPKPDVFVNMTVKNYHVPSTSNYHYSKVLPERNFAFVKSWES